MKRLFDQIHAQITAYIERLKPQPTEGLSGRDLLAMPKQFEELLALLPPDIPEHIYDGYKYGEYDFAFEDICDWLDENELPILPEVYTRLEALGTKLGIENKLTWEILQSRVK